MPSGRKNFLSSGRIQEGEEVKKGRIMGSPGLPLAI